jgi:anti-anti-sigma regulatory factor
MFDIIDNDSERIYVLKCTNNGMNIRFFEESADEFIKSDQRDMVLDLVGQNVMCSLLLASLIRIKRGLAANQRELCIRNCNSHIYRCIELAGLETFFSFSSYAL